MACTCDTMEFTPAEMRFCNNLTGLPDFDASSSACCSDSASSLPLQHATSSNFLSAAGACLPTKPVSTYWDADFAASVCSGKPCYDAPTREPSVEPQPRTRWADIDSDDDLDMSAGVVVDTKGSARQSWADIQSDEEKESCTQPSKQALPAKTRWADLPSDDDEYAAPIETMQKQDAPQNEAIKTQESDEKKTFANTRSDQANYLAQPARHGEAAKWNAQPDTGAQGVPAWKSQYENKKTRQQKPTRQNRKPDSLGHSQCQQRQTWDQQADAKPDRRRGRRQADNKKFQCQFTIGIKEEPKFRVVRKVLGTAGKNMKDIAEQTGAKMRMRGRGSKFLEGPEQQESKDPLMLCVSVHGQAAYDDAIQQISKLLQRIYQEYDLFCRKAGNTEPRLRVQLHEGYREGSR